MLRNIGAVLAGLIAGIAGLSLVEVIGEVLFPVRVAATTADRAALAAEFIALPVQAKLVILLGWFAAGLAGGLAAKWISGRAGPAWVVAILFMLVVAMVLAVLPMPGWMQAASLAAPILGGAIAHHFGPARIAHETIVEDENDWAED